MPSWQCAVRACVNAVYNLGTALVRLSEAVVCPIDVGVGVSLLQVTFDLSNPNPSPLVNDPGAIAGSVPLEDSLSGLVIVWKWCCSTQSGSGLCHCVTPTSLCALCCDSGNVCGLLVVSLRMGVLEEVLFWVCPGPSFRPSFQ